MRNQLKISAVLLMLIVAMFILCDRSNAHTVKMENGIRLVLMGKIVPVDENKKESRVKTSTPNIGPVIQQNK